MEGILNLENWRKFGNDWVGYYIYPIASKVAYEIVINFHYLDTPMVIQSTIVRYVEQNLNES